MLHRRTSSINSTVVPIGRGELEYEQYQIYHALDPQLHRRQHFTTAAYGCMGRHYMAASTSPPQDSHSHVACGCVRRAWARLVSMWDSIQVELHGCYSINRMQTLHEYSKRTTNSRASLMMVLTPLPCLAVVAFADCIPLAPPAEGIRHSGGFWIRAMVASWVYTFSIMEQLRYFVPKLPLTGYTTFALSIPVTVATNGVTFGLALAFGFPLPFTIPVLSIPWSTFIAIAMWFQLRACFRANPQLLRDSLQFVLVVFCEMSLVLIYPAYNSVFYNLSATGQTLFALLLPVIKLIEKNLISAVLRHVDDLKPEIIIFNVEIFNALFVACCLQNSNSIGTNIILVAIDFIQACIALRDVDLMLVEVNALARKLNIGKDQLIETALEISKENPRMEYRVSMLNLKERLQRSRSRRMTTQLIALAADFQRQATRLHAGMASMRVASGRIQPIVSARGPRGHSLPSGQAKKLVIQAQIHIGGSSTPQRGVDTTSSLKCGGVSSKAMAPPITTLAVGGKGGDGSTAPKNQHRPVSIVARMDDKERLRFLQKVLQTLHMTEYLLLVEYTEVMIPIVYSIYLIVLFHLPNRMYYPQLRHMDEQKLQQTISNVLVNAVFELISLVLLAIVLRKKFQSSPFRQLSFVLDCHWPMVQSKVILWVVVTLQSTLDHLGAIIAQSNTILYGFHRTHLAPAYGVNASAMAQMPTIDMNTDPTRPHPPSARSVPPKKTKLTSVAQLREALRFGCDTEITEIAITECAPDTVHGDLLLRILSLPSVTSSLRVLDISYDDLSDAFWLQTEWKKGMRLLQWPSLTTLNLANNRFTEVSLEVINDLVIRCPVLKHLDMSINALGYKLEQKFPCVDITHTFTALARATTCLDTLDISCLHISDDQVLALLGSTTTARSLRRLYLRSNDLTDRSAVAVADALASRTLPCLQVLSLSGNRIGDHGLGAIAFAIEQASVLETLDLEENQITDAGLQTLFHVINGLSHRFPLRYLHLSRNLGNRNGQLVEMIQLKVQEKILETHVVTHSIPTANDPRDAISPSPSPSSPPPLTLSLTGKRLKTTVLLGSVLTDHFAFVVLTAIRHCVATWATLTELDLSGNAIGTAGAWEIGSFLALSPPQLRVLNLSSNQISDESIVGLADGMEWNKVLDELNLNHNQITDHGARQLYLKAFTSNLQRKLLLSEGNPLTSECKVMVSAISQAYDLRKRFLKEFAHLEKLEFVGQKLRQYGAAAVAECLLTTSSAQCTSLDLSHNLLGDEGAVEVAKLLRGYSPLLRLDLSFNDIGDVGAIAIADALRVNTTLASLSLHSSIAGSAATKPKLTETGLSAIAAALEKHKALTNLDLRDNVMAPALIPVLVQTLQRNGRIQKFNGSSSAVFLSRNEA